MSSISKKLRLCQLNSSLSKEKSGAWGSCRRFVHYMVKYKGPVILGSDAHFWDRVGDFSHALELVNEVGIKEYQVLNTSSDRILEYLATRRRNRHVIN